jgi:hypothetical protein
MSTPAGDGAFLRELEVTIRTDLTEAEISETEEEEIALPIGQWQFDPEDTERYQISLRGLLGAVEVLEEGPSPSTSTSPTLE